jgi:hypothetical protein
MKTGTPPTRNWLMKAVQLEADCDISAGPVMPRVKVSAGSRATNGHVRQVRVRTDRPVRRTLAKA